MIFFLIVVYRHNEEYFTHVMAARLYYGQGKPSTRSKPSTFYELYQLTLPLESYVTLMERM